MRPGSISLATRQSRSSIFSSTDIEFASEFVPNTASPTFCDNNQRQCPANRSASGERSALNGVTTGASTPLMRGLAAVTSVIISENDVHLIFARKTEVDY